MRRPKPTRRCVRCRRDLPLSQFDDSLARCQDGRHRRCRDCWRPNPRRGLSPEKRFESYVDRQGTNGCWTWTGYTIHDYGMIYWHGRRMGAHRISWLLTYGPIPDGLCVLHRCDNPPCVRPDHLFLGTDADNGQDRAAKGRSHRPDGQDRRCRLSTDAVRAIRARVAIGERQAALAREYRVSVGAVSMIVSRQRWSHV